MTKMLSNIDANIGIDNIGFKDVLVRNRFQSWCPGKVKGEVNLLNHPPGGRRFGRKAEKNKRRKKHRNMLIF